MEEIIYTMSGCIDCDSCSHRNETCLCDISTNEEECPLIIKEKEK